MAMGTHADSMTAHRASEAKVLSAVDMAISDQSLLLRCNRYDQITEIDKIRWASLTAA
jgi:hypothetical protein